MRRLIRPILLLLALALTGCGEDNPVTPGPPDLPLPTYYSVETGVDNGFLIGWSSVTTPYTDTVWRGETYLPEHHPWSAWRTLELADDPRADWTVGPLGGPPRRGRLAPDAGAWAALRAGWGDLDFGRDLAPADEPALPLDPRSPTAAASLGLAWMAAGRPAWLELTVMVIADPDSTPQVVTATLVSDGPNDTGVHSEDFHLDLPDGTVYFRLFAEHMPAPFAVWWEPQRIYLRYWGGVAPDVSDQAFAPSFPAPQGYSARDTLLDAGALAATVTRPDGDGPFPGVLLIADAALADRNDAAAFGHLAHLLAQAGYVTLRYDKPGTGGTAGDIDALSLDSRRAAIAAAWDALRADPDVDPARCALLGHGEGAALALEAGAAHPEAAAVLALVPPLMNPANVTPIPEAETGADWVDLLGLSVFAGKHRELRETTSADFLADASWAGRPVLLVRAGEDLRLSGVELAMQADWLETAGALVTSLDLDELGPFLNAGLPDAPPDPALTTAIVEWLNSRL
ncbi:MAG: alpha/beta hydrolase [Candidatus Krumholzibacteriia bacterium]